VIIIAAVVSFLEVHQPEVSASVFTKELGLVEGRKSVVMRVKIVQEVVVPRNAVMRPMEIVGATEYTFYILSYTLSLLNKQMNINKLNHN